MSIYTHALICVDDEVHHAWNTYIQASEKKGHVVVVLAKPLQKDV